MANAVTIPTGTNGVYSFVVQPKIADHPNCSYLMYVGETEKQGFRARYRQYLREKKKGPLARKRIHVVRMLRKWDRHMWFLYAPVANSKLIQRIEDELIAAYLPPANREFPSSVRTAIKKLFDV